MKATPFRWMTLKPSSIAAAAVSSEQLWPAITLTTEQSGKNFLGLVLVLVQLVLGMHQGGNMKLIVLRLFLRVFILSHS